MAPVCERFENQIWLVSEGHFIRFTKDLSETEYHLLGYEPNTKFQNLQYETIIWIRLKSAKLKKKTYYKCGTVPEMEISLVNRGPPRVNDA